MLLDNTTLFPVISPVPKFAKDLKGKEKVKFLSEYARKALFKSAELTKLNLKILNKDSRGCPIPYNNIYWSISHKNEYVAGICSKFPIGIDVEKIIDRSENLFNFVASKNEWNIFNRKEKENFFRLFTAKESLIKITVEGMKDIKKCILKRVIDKDHLEMDYNNKKWIIEHFRLNDHIFSITSFSNKVSWNVLHAI